MLVSFEYRILSFSTPWLTAALAQSACNLAIDDAVVVNLSTAPLLYEAGSDRGSISAFQSRHLRRGTVIKGQLVAVFELQQLDNFGGIAREWAWYGQKDPLFDPRTRLYISPQEEIGDVELETRAAFGLPGKDPDGRKRFRLKLNLWYAPAFTDCGIRREHTFLEVHTQLMGTGRMQKFQDKNAETLYEDVIVPVGSTHSPFFTFQPDSTFAYPWHRYYSESDCVWMAIELHPYRNVDHEVGRE
jgi:hypothetical protein